jgi:hypothetical protein
VTDIDDSMVCPSGQFSIDALWSILSAEGGVTQDGIEYETDGGVRLFVAWYAMANCRSTGQGWVQGDVKRDVRVKRGSGRGFQERVRVKSGDGTQ